MGFFRISLLSMITLISLSYASVARAKVDLLRAAGCRHYPHLCQGVRTYQCQGANIAGNVEITGHGQINGYIAFTSKAQLKLRTGRKLKLSRQKGRQSSVVVVVGSFSAGPGPIRIGPSRPTRVYYDGTPTVGYGKIDYGYYHERNIGAVYYHLGQDYFLEVLNGGQTVYGYHGSRDARSNTFACTQH